MMAELVSENRFRLTLEDRLSLQVTSMHESTLFTAEELYDWCRYETDLILRPGPFRRPLCILVRIRGGILSTYNHEQINLTVYEYHDNVTGAEDWTMEVSLDVQLIGSAARSIFLCR